MWWRKGNLPTRRISLEHSSREVLNHCLECKIPITNIRYSGTHKTAEYVDDFWHLYLPSKKGAPEFEKRNSESPKTEVLEGTKVLRLRCTVRWPNGVIWGAPIWSVWGAPFLECLRWTTFRVFELHRFYRIWGAPFLHLFWRTVTTHLLEHLCYTFFEAPLLNPIETNWNKY